MVALCRTPVVGGDSLAEIEGSTLSLYGAGALDAFERSWGVAAAGAVTAVSFDLVDFELIARVLHRIRVRFPNVGVSRCQSLPCSETPEWRDCHFS